MHGLCTRSEWNGPCGQLGKSLLRITFLATTSPQCFLLTLPGMRTMVRHYATILQVGLLTSALSMFALSMFAPGGVAWAIDQGTAEERRACTPDVLKHCPEFIPNAERIEACLREKLPELSPDCRVVMIGSKKR